MRTPFFGVFSAMIFGGFSFKLGPSSIGRHQYQSRAAVLAHILSDPRLPAGPPNAVKRSRRKYHSVVARSGYSVFKVPPAYQKPDAGTEGCSLSPGTPSSWTAALASVNIHCRMHPALDHWYCREVSYLT